MAVRRILLPWDSQPQEAAGVDWENPLASKLLSQVGPGIYDPVTGGLYSLTGGPSISATSMGRALTFNGTTQYASWKYPYSGNPNNFSAAGWIKTTTTNNRAFCGRYETTTNNRSWFMGVANTVWVGAPSGNEFSVVVSTDGGVTNIKAYYTTGISVADDSWHHVAFTFSDGTLLLYVDGAARTTTKNSDAAFTTIYGGTADLSLGAINPSTGGASFSNGSNLGFSVFERALSGAEIAALRSNTWQLSAPRSIWVPVSSGAPASYTLTAAAATYTLTGNAAAVRTSRKLTAAAGSYILTGNAAGLLHGRKLTAAAATYALTANAAILKATRKLTATAASYTWTGVAATLSKSSSSTLTADAASYAWTAQAAGLRASRKLTAAAAGYTLTGNAASLNYSPLGSYSLSANAAAYTLTGNAAGLRASRRLSAATGIFNLTGGAASLIYSGAPSSQRYVSRSRIFFTGRESRSIATQRSTRSINP